MRGNTSKLFCGSLVVLAFLLWPTLSVAADHVLTDQQYQQLIANLTSLAQINTQQQDLLQKQGTTLQAQQQTISNLQASLTEQIALLPQVSKSFDQAVQQARTDTDVWRTVALVAGGGLIGYAVDGPRGALIGGGAGAATGGVLWLFRL